MSAATETGVRQGSTVTVRPCQHTIGAEIGGPWR